MSEGGTIKEQLAQVEKELEEEERLWREADIPPVNQIFNLGNQQFAAHINLIAICEVLKTLVSEDELNLATKKAALHELRKIRPAFHEAKSQAIRQHLVDGIRLMKPPEPEI